MCAQLYGTFWFLVQVFGRKLLDLYLFYVLFFVDANIWLIGEWFALLLQHLWWLPCEWDDFPGNTAVVGSGFTWQ